MTDFMLRTDTEAQMDDALIAAGVAVETDIGEGEIDLVAAEGITIDPIGPIPPSYNADGTIRGNGDPRYHANIRCMVELTQAQIDALPTFTPDPTVPYRVFA